jgi:hypothetical protein
MNYGIVVPKSFSLAELADAARKPMGEEACAAKPTDSKVSRLGFFFIAGVY